MSFEEREGISEEIHGVHCMAIKETPEFVRQRLDALEQALQRIPNQDKMAYLEAIRMQSAYVNDVSQLKLSMLRAEVFDPQKAAVRLVNFLDLVHDLCGKEALMRPMNLTDFTPEDIQLMKEGLFQMLAGRDRTGRRIMGNFADIPAKFSVRSRVRGNVIVVVAAAASAAVGRSSCCSF